MNGCSWGYSQSFDAEKFSPRRNSFLSLSSPFNYIWIPSQRRRVIEAITHDFKLNVIEAKDMETQLTFQFIHHRKSNFLGIMSSDISNTLKLGHAYVSLTFAIIAWNYKYWLISYQLTNIFPNAWMFTKVALSSLESLGVVEMTAFKSNEIKQSI